MSQATDNPDSGGDPDTDVDDGELLTYHEHRTGEELSNREKAKRQRVQDAIDEGHTAQSKGQYDKLASLIVGVLVPALDLRRWNLWTYDSQLDPSPYQWDYDSLRQFFSEEYRYISPEDVSESDRVDARMKRAETPEEHRRTVLDGVFESLESAAILEGYLPSELEETQPVYGFQNRLGERYVRADSSAGGRLRVRDPDDELKAVLCAGSKGSGKSTAVETLVLDSYANGHKIVDLVDFFKCENAMYDIPQQEPTNSDLIEAREKMGLDPGFEGDFGRPELEIMAPLSKDLEDLRIPYDEDSDEPVVKPFTIPASDLNFRQLVMLLHNTTPTQENHLRSAHQKLKNSGKDWTLKDVARTVREETGAGDSICDRIETALETAQGKSFIRDQKCEHGLDWSEVMRDEDVITSFTVHTIREPADRLLVLSYLIDSIYDARDRIGTQQLLSEFPPLTIVMREMHKVAPRNKSEQDSESTIEGYLIDTLSELFALMRHAKMEIIADTQEFKQQLSADVSGLFDHIYTFQGHVPDVKKIFKTRIDRTDPAETVAQFEEPGKCALVNENGAKWPIKFAPPRCHHLEAKHDGSGLGMRARVDDTDETLVYAPWNASVPEHLQFELTPDDPVEEFCKAYIRKTGKQKDYAVKEYITDTYNQWAEKEGKKTMAHGPLQKRIIDHFDLHDVPDKRPVIDGDKKRAHKGIVLLGEEVPI